MRNGGTGSRSCNGLFPLCHRQEAAVKTVKAVNFYYGLYATLKYSENAFLPAEWFYEGMCVGRKRGGVGA